MNKEKQSPLHLAAMEGFDDVVEILLREVKSDQILRYKHASVKRDAGGDTRQICGQKSTTMDQSTPSSIRQRHDSHANLRHESSPLVRELDLS